MLRIWGWVAPLWPNTRTHTKWVTHLLSRYAGDVYLFLAQIEFPVLDSAARGAQQHNSLYPGAGSCPGCICNTELSSLFWSGAGKVLICRRQSRGVRGPRMSSKTYGEFEIAKSLWCCAIDLKRYRIQLLVEDESWQTGKGKFIAARFRFSGYMLYVVGLDCMLLNTV